MPCQQNFYPINVEGNLLTSSNFQKIGCFLRATNYGNSYTQDDINANGVKTFKKGIHEISYQLPLAIGYNYIQNFNGKFLFGAGIHAGVCYYFRYIDLLQIKFFTRNVFNKNKLMRKIDYDIGLFFSYPYFELEVDAVYGLTTSMYYNIWKMKIGIDVLFAAIQENGKTENFPSILLTPILIYKF